MAQLVTSYSQTTKAIAKLKPPYMVKAQVLAGGRGKAGGIIPAESVKEAEDVVCKTSWSANIGFTC